MIRLRDSVTRRASTYVYKGTTRQRFRDRQQLESQKKLVCSLVIETPSIPSQLDVGFYLHRRGRTSIKSPCPLVRFNPFELTRSDGSTTKSFHKDICRDKPTTLFIVLILAHSSPLDMVGLSHHLLATPSPPECLSGPYLLLTHAVVYMN